MFEIISKDKVLISTQSITGGPAASRSTLWKTAKVKHMPEGNNLLSTKHSVTVSHCFIY